MKGWERWHAFIQCITRVVLQCFTRVVGWQDALWSAYSLLDRNRGLTFEDLARILLNSGARYAINMDGGSSSTMVHLFANGQFRPSSVLRIPLGVARSNPKGHAQNDTSIFHQTMLPGFEDGRLYPSPILATYSSCEQEDALVSASTGWSLVSLLQVTQNGPLGKASGSLRTKYIKYTSRVIRKYDILLLHSCGGEWSWIHGWPVRERQYPFLSPRPSADWDIVHGPKWMRNLATSFLWRVSGCQRIRLSNERRRLCS